MPRPKQAVLLTVALMFGAAQVRANVPALGNREAARRLCELAAAATATYRQPTTTTAGAEAFNKLNALNLSSSPPAALKVFKHKGDDQGWQNEPPDSLKQTKPWDTLYTYWLEGAKVLDAIKEDKDNEITDATTGLTPEQAAEVQIALAPLLQRAKREHDKLAAAQSKLKEPTSTGIKTALAKAIYGAATDDGNLADTAIFKAAPSGANREALCNDASGDGNVKTVAAALICICAPDNDGSEAKACFQTATAINVWNEQADSAKTIWNAIKVHCGLPGSGDLTPTRLDTALNNVLSQITIDNSNGYLGTLHTGTSCTGANNAGMCIKFAGATKAAASQVQTNTWIKAISDSISQLQAVEIASKSQDQATEALETILSEGLAAAQAIRHKPKPKPVTEIANPNTQATETDCNKHQSQNECKKPCQWNENATVITKKCSLDPKNVAEQQTTQEGTGEAKKEEKCAGKGEKECKDGCKWEGTECKDSSILVNKQFSLSVVSAAFVALLF